MSLFAALAQALRIPELRKKILWTCGLMFATRVLASVSIPGASSAALSAEFGKNSLLGLLNIFSGGGLSNFSLIALGLNPYINATIIMQLMQQVSTRLKELAKEGQQGQRKITRYQRWLTVPLALLQSFGFIQLFKSDGVLPADIGTGTTLEDMLIMTAGTVVLMWLGELITEYGVGNGISIIIFAGIIGRLPASVINYAQGGSSQIAQIIAMAIIAILATAFIIYVQQASRKVPIQSAQRVVNARAGAMTQRRRTDLPIRINAAGVIPIIFAISIMAFPTIFANFFQPAVGDPNPGPVSTVSTWIHNNWQPNGGVIWADILYNGLYFLLIFGFTYFYTYVVFQPEDVADNMKKSSTFIPGIRPGRSTAEYLSKVLSRVTFAGALFLAVVTVVLPLITSFFTRVAPASLYLGGTAILIVVGVALDTMKQIETQLQMRQYRGFIR